MQDLLQAQWIKISSKVTQDAIRTGQQKDYESRDQESKGRGGLAVAVLACRNEKTPYRMCVPLPLAYSCSSLRY